VQPPFYRWLDGSVGFGIELLSGKGGIFMFRGFDIWVTSWSTDGRVDGVNRTVVLGSWGERPIVVGKNVPIGHLGTPVSPSAGRQILKIVLK